jgi:hypothetical protein
MTTEEQLSQFTLRIASPEADAEELEELTRQLRDEIAEVNVESVGLMPGAPAPEGAKGAQATMQGQLAVTLRPNALPDFLGMLRDWLTRHEDRRVEVTLNIGGNPVNIKAAADDLAKVMQALYDAPAINRSGGADLNADQISVGGDVTGRDKIIAIHAEAGAAVYIGQTGPASVKIDNEAAASQSPTPPVAA